jgi:hypothetical protein
MRLVGRKVVGGDWEQSSELIATKRINAQSNDVLLPAHLSARTCTGLL